jgi:hypothetical protein
MNDKTEIVGLMAVSNDDLNLMYGTLRERITRLTALREEQEKGAKRTGINNERFIRLIESRIDSATRMLARIVKLYREANDDR